MRVYMLLLVFAMATSILLTPAVRRAALTFQVLTPLRARDVHVVPTPRMGGIAITGGFAAALFLGRAIPYLEPAFRGSVVWTVLGGAIAICILGVVDDVWELDWMAKLAGQLIICAVMAMNGVQLISFPVFGITIGSSRLSVLVSVLVMVTIINAVNFIDGLDGLAAGVITIGAAAFFMYSYLLSRSSGAHTYATSAAVLMAAVVGGCLGFLWYNFHPASIFMGDAGSMVLGLLMGSAGIIVTGQLNPTVLGEHAVLTAILPLLLPFVVIIIPVVDLVLTALRRLLQGKSPFTADRTHLHDRLLDRGHSHRGVVLNLYGWTAIACACGVSLLVMSPWVVLLCTAAAVLVMILLTWVTYPGSGFRLRSGAGRSKGAKVSLVDDGIAVISRPQVSWKSRFSQFKEDGK